MAQRKHLDDFLCGRIIGRLECGRTQLEVSEELGIAQSVISRLWQRFQDDVGPDFLLMDDNARPHIAHLVDKFLEMMSIHRMNSVTRYSDLLIEHALDALERAIPTRNTHPRPENSVAE
ncbi:cubilin [Trichonephila clavipes]|nr:cubilin [Trichonephila clavipes]